MAKNRSIEQKKLKMKRRNRFARLSGATSRSSERVGPTPFTEDEYGNTTTGRTRMVLVGPVSLSKQVINTGRGPDAERMQEYYQRLHSYDVDLPQTLGLSEPMKELMRKYDEVLRETPKDMRISLVNNPTGRLDLYFCGKQFFFVDVDYRTKVIKRSRVYGSKDYAMKQLQHKTITWVENISARKIASNPP